MTCTISSLPLEILEKILTNLHGESLIRASQVCWQWAYIAQRMMSKTNATSFSPELLEDIQRDVQEKLGDPLVDVYRESIERVQMENEMEAVEIGHCVSGFEVDGHHAYVAEGSGTLLVYELIDSGGDSPPFLSPTPVSTMLEDGPVVHLGLMKRHEIIVTVTPSSLHIFSTRRTENGVVSLDPVTPSIPLEHKAMTLRVHRDMFGVTDGPAHLKIFRVINVEGGVANMEQIADFNTPCGIFRWKLWNDQVMCILKTGGLAVWDLNENDFCHISEPYHELRYQNPCWMYQRYVMCSSELSRNLLCRYIYMMPTCPAAYWHISCGPSYWLFGRLDGKHTPEPEKYRGVLPADVTSMCLRRRVFVCAKRMPNQLFVYMMPHELPHDKDALTTALTSPLLMIPVPDHVQQIDIGFDGPRLLVFTVSQPCFLRCYVLNRDDITSSAADLGEGSSSSSETVTPDLSSEPLSHQDDEVSSAGPVQ